MNVITQATFNAKSHPEVEITVQSVGRLKQFPLFTEVREARAELLVANMRLDAFKRKHGDAKISDLPGEDVALLQELLNTIRGAEERIAAAWVKDGVVSVRGIELDGAEMTPEQFAKYAPFDLHQEAFTAIQWFQNQGEPKPWEETEVAAAA